MRLAGPSIRPAARGELDRIAAIDPTRPAALHRRRIEMQEAGVAVHLGAWLGGDAVAHALVKLDSALTAQAEEHGCAEVEDLFVAERLRGGGIGSAGRYLVKELR